MTPAAAEEETMPSIDQVNFKISVKVALSIVVFIIGMAAAATVWAQNVTNHLSSLDTTLAEVSKTLAKVQEMSVLQERTTQLDGRVQRLEEWRLREVQSAAH